MPARDKLAQAEISAGDVQTGGWVSPHVLCSVVTCEFRDAGAIPAASTFSEQATRADNGRQSTSKASDDDGVAARNGSRDFRQLTTANGGSRPPRATESATRIMAEYPDSAVVAAGWPQLPEAVRAGIVAMVKSVPRKHV